MLNHAPRPRGRIRSWFLADLGETPGAHQARPQHTAPWWQVMCLTGVDYFSTLGYQPSIAFIAAGFLSPFATIVHRAADVAGRRAGLQPDRRAQPARARQPLGARRAPAEMAGEGARPVSARVRGHRLRHHHHALGRGRDRAHRREPVRPGLDASPDDRDADAGRGARRGLSQGLSGSDLARGGAGRRSTSA